MKINQKNQLFIVIFGMLVALLFLSAGILLYQQKKGETKSFPTIMPTIKPTPFPIADFTGVSEETGIQKTEIAFSKQKSSLRKICPVKESFGTISFNFDKDVFAVDLNKQINTSQSLFNSWIKNNYPLLTSEQFIIQ